MSKKIIDFKPSESKEQIPNISKLLNQTFVIEAVEFREGSFGEWAIITTDKGVYRTSSKVLVDQLHQIEDLLFQGYDGVRVKLIKRNRYYTFTSPD